MRNPPGRSRRRRRIGVALLALLAFGACSGSDDDTGVATLDNGGNVDDPTSGDDVAVDGESALLAFSACMRGEGIENFPDLAGENPFTDVLDSDIDVTSPEFTDALDECQPELEGVIGLDDIDPLQQAQLEDAVVGIARCLRDRGHDIPDPDFSDGFGIRSFGDLSQLDVDFDDPAFAADLRACFAQVTFGSSGGEGSGEG